MSERLVGGKFTMTIALRPFGRGRMEEFGNFCFEVDWKITQTLLSKLQLMGKLVPSSLPPTS